MTTDWFAAWCEWVDGKTNEEIETELDIRRDPDQPAGGAE